MKRHRQVSQAQILRAAYLSTNFDYQTEYGKHTLRIGEPNQILAQLIASFGAAGAAFVTAYNPGSVDMGPVHNRLAMDALRGDLDKCIKVLEGEGASPDSSWPIEPSLLVFGISRPDACELGRKYGQNAIVWIGTDGIPELVELFDFSKIRKSDRRLPPIESVELTVDWSYVSTSITIPWPRSGQDSSI